MANITSLIFVLSAAIQILLQMLDEQIALHNGDSENERLANLNVVTTFFCAVAMLAGADTTKDHNKGMALYALAQVRRGDSTSQSCPELILSNSCIMLS